MKDYDFEVFIIGEGSAGLTAAAVASGLGKKTAMADRARLGGECTWSGCVPSKALIKQASACRCLDESRIHGVQLKPFRGRSETARIFSAVNEIMESVYRGHPPEEYEKSGITVFENCEVSFIDSETLLIGDSQVRAEKIIIAAGSSPAVPPIPGLDVTPYETNQTIFSLKKAPASLAVIGAGAIGVEMATAFSQLGTEVTLLDAAERVLPLEDEEISSFIKKRLLELGVRVLTGVSISRIKDGKRLKSVECSSGEEQVTIRAEKILIAAGRKPNIDRLNLEKAGVAFSKKGIETDRKMRTSVKNIYACGDVTGPYQFSHMAGYQASSAAANAILPFKRKVSYRHVPWVIFSSPETARSGLTEKEASEHYRGNILVFRKDYAELDRSKTDGTGHGFAKVITDRKYRILGIHISGERAGEVMHELHAAKTLGIKLYRLQNVIHAYPTYSDLVRYLAKDAYIDRIRKNPAVKAIARLKELFNAHK